jgi:hypothetical protein
MASFKNIDPIALPAKHIPRSPWVIASDVPFGFNGPDMQYGTRSTLIAMSTFLFPSDSRESDAKWTVPSRRHISQRVTSLAPSAADYVSLLHSNGEDRHRMSASGGDDAPANDAPADAVYQRPRAADPIRSNCSSSGTEASVAAPLTASPRSQQVSCRAALST